jgi:hypothetical protein
MLFGASAALAAEPMAPNDIKATFFTGQPFTAASPSGAKFKMTFTPDGKISFRRVFLLSKKVRQETRLQSATMLPQQLVGVLEAT